MTIRVYFQNVIAWVQTIFPNYRKENLQMLCKECNRRKGAK